MIDKVDLIGRSLIKAKHFASPSIEEKSRELSDAWKQLLEQSARRKKNLDASVEKQKVIV